MRMNRRALRKIRRTKRGSHVASVNLVSMIDMFMIMIIYLLVNTAAVQVMGAELVKLPESLADAPPRQSVAIIVTNTELLVDGKALMSVAQAKAAKGLVIEALKQRLLEESPPTEAQKLAVANGETPESGEVNILADKTVPYSLLKRVLSTCTDAAFGDISLGVLPRGNVK